MGWKDSKTWRGTAGTRGQHYFSRANQLVAAWLPFGESQSSQTKYKNKHHKHIGVAYLAQKNKLEACVRVLLVRRLRRVGLERVSVLNHLPVGQNMAVFVE